VRAGRHRFAWGDHARHGRHARPSCWAWACRDGRGLHLGLLIATRAGRVM